jgi:hypothetical protein
VSQWPAIRGLPPLDRLAFDEVLLAAAKVQAFVVRSRSFYLPFLIAAVGLDRRQNQTFAAT